MSRFLRKKRDKTLNVHLPYLYIKCQKFIIFGIFYISFHCCPVKVPDDYYKV